MPSFKFRKCASTLCNERVVSGYCDECSKERERKFDKRRGSATARGYDARWHKVRNKKLKLTPLCECGCEHSADTVHHILPAHIFKRYRLYLPNLMSLTRNCHEQLENILGTRGFNSEQRKVDIDLVSDEIIEEERARQIELMGE